MPLSQTCATRHRHQPSVSASVHPWAWLVVLLCGLAPPAPLLAQTAATSADDPLIFGLLPFTSPMTLMQRFAPLRRYLSEQTGTPIDLRTAPDFPAHIQRIVLGEYDLLMTAPHFVPLALDSGHYHLLAAYKEPLAVFFVVQEADTTTRLQDLAGQRIATPPLEAVITMVARQHLAGHLDADAPAPAWIATPSHNAAVQMVLNGLADAAAVSINVARMALAKEQAIRVIAQSDSFPGLGILAHERVPVALRQQIQTVFLQMDQHPEGQRVLEEILYSGYIEVMPENYDGLRRLTPVWDAEQLAPTALH